MHEPLEGIAQADAVLGRPFPLPSAALPLARWVDVVHVAERGVEVAWNLDDTRPGTPGAPGALRRTRARRRIAISPTPARFTTRTGSRCVRRRCPRRRPSLRPVTELRWQRDGLHLRLTAQGAWEIEALLALARSV